MLSHEIDLLYTRAILFILKNKNYNKFIYARKFQVLFLQTQKNNTNFNESPLINYNNFLLLFSEKNPSIIPYINEIYKNPLQRDMELFEWAQKYSESITN